MYANKTIDFTYHIEVAGQVVAEIEGRADVTFALGDEFHIEDVNADSVEFIAGLARDHSGAIKRDWQGRAVWNYVAPTKDDQQGKALQQTIADWIAGPGAQGILDATDYDELNADARAAFEESRAEFRAAE